MYTLLLSIFIPHTPSDRQARHVIARHMHAGLSEAQHALSWGALRGHWDLQVSNSQAKFYENFANYFLKIKANNKCFTVLKCTCKGLQKSISELER